MIAVHPDCWRLVQTLPFAVLLILAPWSAIRASTLADPPPALVEFSEDNFGVRFSHSPILRTQYNPHGGATRVLILRDDSPVGEMQILSLPPTVSAAEFVESGREHFRKSLGAGVVATNDIKNPHGFTFHHFRTSISRDESDFVAHRFIYLHGTREAPKDDSEVGRVLLLGTYVFDFVLPQSSHDTLEPAVMTVIHSFRIQSP